MTWKSYAAMSGATVVAGWLAASPPSNTPAATAVSQTRSPRAVTPAENDIEHQAARLQSRLRTAREYAAPRRNPFRFAARTADAPDLAARGVPEASASPVDLTPAAPQVSLSGIAEEQVDGRAERTAILSSPAGVLLVREGEEILGYYRVTRIESEAVELTAVGDGATRRLTFAPSQLQ
ncbi:MAG: hypothetical protein ACRD3C_17105 [Vicinamibacterales bacterium]